MTNIFIPEKEYFSIKEVSNLTQIKQHTLRYWETEFKLLRPLRRESGHRKYTKKDIDIILKIKDLLYNKKYTIEGARKYLIKEKRTKPEQLKIELEQSSASIEILKETKKTLEEILEILK
jgi:DNA-binding transcriptional MerR regulator